MWDETGVQPKALRDEPQLLDCWVYPYKTWSALSSSRNYNTAGPAGIPFSEFFLWALAHGYTLEDMADTWPAIHIVDETWCSVLAQRRSDEAERRKKEAERHRGTPRR